MLTVRSSKLAVLTYFGQFSMLLLIVLGVLHRFEHSGNPGSANGEVTKTRSFDLFWPVSMHLLIVLGVPRLFERLGNPGDR